MLFVDKGFKCLGKNVTCQRIFGEKNQGRRNGGKFRFKQKKIMASLQKLDFDIGHTLFHI